MSSPMRAGWGSVPPIWFTTAAGSRVLVVDLVGEAGDLQRGLEQVAVAQAEQPDRVEYERSRPRGWRRRPRPRRRRPSSSPGTTSAATGSIDPLSVVDADSSSPPPPAAPQPASVESTASAAATASATPVHHRATTSRVPTA